MNDDFEIVSHMFPILMNIWANNDGEIGNRHEIGSSTVCYFYFDMQKEGPRLCQRLSHV